MELSQCIKNNQTFITIIGQLWQKEDLCTLEDAVNTLLEQKTVNIIIDLQRLSFINSQGLGLLVRIYSSLAEAGGNLILYSVPSSVLEVIELSGFETFMTIVRNDQELNAIIGG
jgi:anti-anti-sigma factor